MRHFLYFLSAILIPVFLLSAVPFRAVAEGDTRITDLRVDNRTEPLNVAEVSFSWKMESSQRDQYQTAYRITLVDSDGKTVWDSGKVESDQSYAVPYEGDGLESNSRYTWSLTVWDKDGNALAAQNSFFETALSAEDWQADFIAAGARKTVDRQNYTFEADLQIVNHATGLIVGGLDARNFVCVQLTARNGSSLRIRVITHTNGSAKAVYNQDISALFPFSEAYKPHHLKVEVSAGGVMKFYLDDISVGAYTDEKAVMNGIGFRHTKSSNDDEQAYYDNIRVTADGEELCFLNFEDGFNPFSAGAVTDGRLFMEKNTEFYSLKDTNAIRPFTIETDFRVESVACGLIFGAKDSGNLLMWQVNITRNESASQVVLCPHTCIGGTYSRLAVIDLSAAIPWAARFDTHHIKIQVSADQVITTYVNDVLVDRRTLSTACFGGVGFRQTKGDGERCFIDNYTITDGDGKVLIQADFEDHLDPFSSGHTVDGELYLNKTGVFWREIEQKGAPYYRKSFETLPGKTVVSARFHATALGIYEASLNGEKIGNEVLAPGWTEYTEALEYQTYDVTSQIAECENVLGVAVGNGWYAGHIGELSTPSNDQRWGAETAFFGQLEITYTDGTRQIVATDDSWKASTDSPYLVTDNSNGETYDARREIPGWNTAGFDDSDWQATRKVTKENTNTKVDVSAVDLLPAATGIVDAREITPVSITKLNGVYVIDMGQNFSGVVRLSLTGKAGQTVRLRYGEVLYDSLTPELEGMIYTENLRTALATDYYTFRDSEPAVYEPAFTYHGFRYVELVGWEGELTEENIVGIVRTQDVAYNGQIETGSELVNQLFSNVLWSQISNYLTVPTDCPQRDERLGWTGDAQIFAETAMYNADILNFMEKYLTEMRRTQAEDGSVTNYAPTWNSNKASAGWGDAAVIIPWVLYTFYGDSGILEEYYDLMAGWIRYQISQSTYSTDGTYIIPDCNYGDWLSVGETSPKDVVATEYFGYSASLMEKAARVLGKTEDAETYGAIFQKTVQDFTAKYVRNGRITGDTQTVYVLALSFDLAGENREAFAARLAEKIIANDYHFTCGFMGVSYVCPVLSDNGYDELAYQLLLQNTYPSWGYSVENGATTIWERWNSYVQGKGYQSGMNSFNHYSYGSIAEWMYRYMGGITQKEGDAGYRHLLLDAHMSEEIGYANASTQTVYGTVKSAWKLKNGRYSWTVTVPANSDATVVLKKEDRLYLDGGAIEGAKGVRSMTEEGDTLLVTIGSGTYTFSNSSTRYDLNRDGEENTGDVVTLLQHLNGWDVDIDLNLADVNGDTKVSVFDAVRLLQILAA